MYCICAYNLYKFGEEENSSFEINLIQVGIFARLEVGDIEFESLDLKCLTFLKYPEIVAFNDD